MHEIPDMNQEFWGIVTNLAAEDPRLVRALSGVLLELPLEDEVSDYGDMSEYLYNRYGLGREGSIDAAFELCEQKILRAVYSSAHTGESVIGTLDF
jgi:hypothetical protein